MAARRPVAGSLFVLSATQPPNPSPCRPRCMDETRELIGISALTFGSEAGTRGMEGQVSPLIVAETVGACGGEWIADPTARAFPERLSEDETLQAEVAMDWAERVAPTIIEKERTFQLAFGDNLQVVRLCVPLVTGYEDRDRPALIRPQIRAFWRLSGRTKGMVRTRRWLCRSPWRWWVHRLHGVERSGSESVAIGPKVFWNPAGAWVLAFLLAAAPISAGADPMAAMEDRFADLGELRIEYCRFGDTGEPVVLVQDHHDDSHDVVGPSCRD